MAWFDRGKLVIMDPSATGVAETPLELLLDVISIGLMRATYTPNLVTHQQYDDVTTSAIVATDYIEPGAAGSHVLAGKAIAISSGVAEFDATDLTFTGIGNGANDTFDQIVVCRQNTTTPTEATTELIATVVVPTTITNNGNITLVWDATGLLRLT